MVMLEECEEKKRMEDGVEKGGEEEEDEGLEEQGEGGTGGAGRHGSARSQARAAGP